MGEANFVEDEGYFCKLVCKTPEFPGSGDKNLLVQGGGHLSCRKFYGLFLGRKG